MIKACVRVIEIIFVSLRVILSFAYAVWYLLFSLNLSSEPVMNAFILSGVFMGASAFFVSQFSLKLQEWDDD